MFNIYKFPSRTQKQAPAASETSVVLSATTPLQFQARKTSDSRENGKDLNSAVWCGEKGKGSLSYWETQREIQKIWCKMEGYEISGTDHPWRNWGQWCRRAEMRRCHSRWVAIIKVAGSAWDFEDVWGSSSAHRDKPLLSWCIDNSIQRHTLGFDYFLKLRVPVHHDQARVVNYSARQNQRIFEW